MRGFWRRRGRYSDAEFEDRVRIGVAVHIAGLDGDWRRAWLLTEAGRIAGLLEDGETPAGLTVTVTARDGARVAYGISPGDPWPERELLAEDEFGELRPVDVPDNVAGLEGDG